MSQTFSSQRTRNNQAASLEIVCSCVANRRHRHAASEGAEPFNRATYPLSSSVGSLSAEGGGKKT